jgi:lathosterol oxidase
MTRPDCPFDIFIAVWPTIFAFDLSRYLVAAGGLAFALAIFARRIAHRRIQTKKATAGDVRREIVYSLATVLIFSLIGFGVLVGSQRGVFNVYGGDWPGPGRQLAELLAIVVLHDAYFYWAHRAMHHRLLFRRFHLLHHKSHTPTPWAAYAFAPLEAVVEAGILPLAAVLMPMHELTVLIFVTHMIVRNVIGHAGFEVFPHSWLRVPLLRAVTTTTHHDLHHSHSGYNYGLYFTWWDRWMGTEHPQYRQRFEMAVEPKLIGSTFVEE